MELLLDTHAFLWWMEGGSALSAQALAAIESPASTVYLSAASAWDISIKHAKGRLETPNDLTGALDASAFRELPVTVEHAEAVGSLPQHHVDPFDRILVAQAKVEGLTIITRDPALAAYGVPVPAA
jgi:PIN domain nuclease of toxin-antitoxin system